MFKLMEFANIKDVARLANVSVSTVSRVLNSSGYASANVRERVIDAVRRLDYKPNLIARGLKNNSLRTIALVVTDITNPFFAAIAKETEDLLSEYDYSLIICNTNERPDKELRHLRQLGERQVDGIFLCGTGQNNEFVKRLAASGVVIIQIDRDYDDLDFDIIKDDNVYGAQLLTEQLINKGYKSIALLRGHPDSRASAEREQGYLFALQKNGITPDRNLIFNAGASGEETQAILKKLLEMQSRPGAIVSLNALIAKKIISEFRTLGIRIPEDMAIASYGLEEFKSLYVPSVTCIVQKPERFGEVSVNLMMERLKKKTDAADSERKCILFAPELFIGESI